MPRKKKQQTVIERMPLKYVAVILIAIFLLAGLINSWLPRNEPDRQALPTATLPAWPPTYDETHGWDWCHQNRFFPAGYYQHNGIVNDGILCNSANGHYIGPCACDYNYVVVLNTQGTPIATYTVTPSSTPPQTSTQTATRTPTASATATKTQTYTPTPTKTPTVTASKTATLTYTPVPPTFTATFTPIPPSVTSTPTLVTPTLCAKIVYFRNVNIRPSASMSNTSIGYYLPGVSVPIEKTITNAEGTWAQVNFGQWFAVWLKSNNRTYAILGECR